MLPLIQTPGFARQQDFPLTPVHLKTRRNALG
jgi:hypothetical protein